MRANIRVEEVQPEDRVRQRSLYDPTLDLAVFTPDGDVAGYAPFWPARGRLRR